jgi:hypothetical protein
MSDQLVPLGNKSVLLNPESAQSVPNARQPVEGVGARAPSNIVGKFRGGAPRSGLLLPL